MNLPITVTRGFAWMVARMFPNADPKTLFAFTDLNTLLFLLDDFLDHSPENGQTGKDLKGVQTLISTFTGIMDPIPGPIPNNPIFLAMEELWSRISGFSSHAWQINFRISIRQIFEAAIWQHKNVARGIWPSVAEYMEQRQFLGAANIATDTIAVADKIRLPQALYRHPSLAKLTVLARNTVCWANDLFSLSKEVGHGDYHNLVVLLEHHYKFSRKQAIKRAILIHNNQVSQFINLSRKLPFSSPHIKNEVIRYVNGLENIMIANIHWSDYETSRYEYNYAEEITKTSSRPHYLLQEQE